PCARRGRRGEPAATTGIEERSRRAGRGSAPRQPCPQAPFDTPQLVEGKPLVIRVSEAWITRPVVDRRDAERREARHVGPAVLGARVATHRGEEGPTERRLESGTRALREVHGDNLEALEESAHAIE